MLSPFSLRYTVGFFFAGWTLTKGIAREMGFLVDLLGMTSREMGGDGCTLSWDRWRHR